MFDYIWGRVKSLLGANGVGQSEARHWHHRVYGGLVCQFLTSHFSTINFSCLSGCSYWCTGRYYDTPSK
jgi:hypothetical protein